MQIEQRKFSKKCSMSGAIERAYDITVACTVDLLEISKVFH
jgi:hypothetical protein